MSDTTKCTDCGDIVDTSLITYYNITGCELCPKCEELDIEKEEALLSEDKKKNGTIYL